MSYLLDMVGNQALIARQNLFDFLELSKLIFCEFTTIIVNKNSFFNGNKQNVIQFICVVKILSG